MIATTAPFESSPAWAKIGTHPTTMAPTSTGAAAEPDSGPKLRLRDDPILCGVNPLPGKIGPKALVGRQPDVGWGRFPERKLITFERALIKVVVLRVLRLSTLRRVVVQWPGQHLLVKARPIRVGVAQVQVPGLIDLLGRRADMPGRHRQENEPFVFNDYALGIRGTPRVLARQSFREAQTARPTVDVKRENVFVKAVVFHRVFLTRVKVGIRHAYPLFTPRHPPRP